jgi:hypothetical protein
MTDDDATTPFGFQADGLTYDDAPAPTPIKPTAQTRSADTALSASRPTTLIGRSTSKMIGAAFEDNMSGSRRRRVSPVRAL